MSGSPFSVDPFYEYDAPQFADFTALPSQGALVSWFAAKSDSSPTMLKAPVLLQLEQARASTVGTSAVPLDSPSCDELASAVASDDELTVTTALATRFEEAAADLSDLDDGDKDSVDSDTDDGDDLASVASSFDSVATEVINFAATPSAHAAAAPTATAATATPQTIKTALMLERCDAAQDELTQRIQALKSQISHLRASVPQVPPVPPAVAAASISTASSATAAPSTYFEAVSRVKKNIGLVADKESELLQLQLLQREMHQSKTPQEKQTRQHRHSAHRRRQSTHTSAVRVLRNESAFMTPSHSRHMTSSDATGPIRLMATGATRVIDQSQPAMMASSHHAQIVHSAVTPRRALAPGTAFKRQQSLLQTGALRIDTAAAAAVSAQLAAAEEESGAESAELQVQTARPSSAHRRRSHSRHSTPRRPHSHRTPRSPPMYNDVDVDVDDDDVGDGHQHRHHRTPRAGEHATPRSTHRARSHSRGATRRDAAAPETAPADHKHRRRRSHSRGENGGHHHHHRARTASVPPTPLQSSLATRPRSRTIETSSPNKARVERALVADADFAHLPRFMQPTESAVMRNNEQKRERDHVATATIARDRWDISEPAPVKHTISQLDREAVQKMQQLAALSPPPMPPPPTAPPKAKVQRGWSLVPDPQAQPQAQPPQRAIARSESLTVAASKQVSKPVARSTTLTMASTRQPLQSLSANAPAAPTAARKAEPHDWASLTTEERQLREMAEARRKLHQHVMAKPISTVPKFVRRPAAAAAKPTN
jgi:hypothetical protein